MKDLGKIIRYHRKKAGVTQVELADLAGVGKTVVFDIEHGKESVQFNSLLKILKALNISMQFHSSLMKSFINKNHYEIS